MSPDRATRPLIKLLRLKVDRYRNVEPGTELRFNAGLNVLLGKNGTGKTTLLSLIACCFRGDFSRLRRENFALEYELGNNDWTLTVAIRNDRRPRVSRPLRSRAFSHRVEAFENFASVIIKHRQLSGIYTLYAGTSVRRMPDDVGEGPFLIRLDTSCLEPSFIADAITKLAASVEAYVEKSLSALDRLDESAVVELFAHSGDHEYEKTVEYLEQKYMGDRRGLFADLDRRGYVEKLAAIDTMFEPILFFTKYMDHLVSLAIGLETLITNTVRFDESLDVFQRVTYSADRDWLAGPHCTVMRIGEGGPQSVDDSGVFRPTVARTLIPRSISRKVLQSVSKDPDLRELRLDNTDLDFLATVVRLFEFQQAEVRIERTNKDVSGGGEAVTFGHLKFDFIRRDDSVIHHDRLSYGQKRLLAFLYCVEANAHVVIADELVNGLHHGWIAACMRSLGRRQVFLTSQNPLLFDYLQFESAVQVARSFIMCRVVREADEANTGELRENMSWRNIEAREAETFFSAYRFGNQHVGALLRTMGLW